MELFIIDAISPFFRGLNKKTINWSKIPFKHLQNGIMTDPHKVQRLLEEFDYFCLTAKTMGYNSVTLDDVAHLTWCENYSTDLKQKIKRFQKVFKELFKIAQKHSLKIFVTTDAYIRERDSKRKSSSGQWQLEMQNLMLNFIEQWPQVEGVIFRLGESDSSDVRSDLISCLKIRSPEEANRYLHKMCDLFEMKKKTIIVRTWTVGAHPIGDLIWNQKTFKKVFESLEGRSLIISMKYGESDFFRYLPLNRHFFRTQIPKIVELQTRREYEGFGEFPSSIGKDYESYAEELLGAPQMVGIMVWCQTGGWSGFNRLSFLEGGSVWNEINTFATIKIFRERISFARAIRQYHQIHHLHGDWVDLLELMNLSERVVKELLYLDQFARKKIFFRRLRIPPLLTVYWDRIMINRPLRKLLAVFCDDGPAKVAQGFEVLNTIRRMQVKAESLHLPVEDIEFMADTFEILACSRAFYLLENPEKEIPHLKMLKIKYKEKYRDRRPFKVKIRVEGFRWSQHSLGLLYRFFLREKRGYRYIDHLVTLRLLTWIYPILRILGGRWIPSYARKRAMGIDTLFK